jgi:adenylate kinase
MLDRSQIQLNGVINIDVSAEEVVMRLSQRLVCANCGTIVTTDKNVNTGDPCIHCGGCLVRRKDDEPETIRHRLEVYEREIRSLIQYYEERRILKDVDGYGSMDDVYKRIVSALEIYPVNA